MSGVYTASVRFVQRKVAPLRSASATVAERTQVFGPVRIRYPVVTSAAEVTLIDTIAHRAVWVPLERLVREDVVLYPVELRTRLRTFYPGLTTGR